MSTNTEGFKKSFLFHLLIIATLAIGLYLNTLKNGFVYDDGRQIVNNVLINSIGNVPLLFDKTAYFSRSGEMSYRPVVTVTYFIDSALYGLKPWGYHLTNVLLHALNGGLLYFFLTLLLTPYSSRFTSLPFLISILFISHPALTEAVNCISYREDLLVFLFYVATLSLYLRLRQPTSDHRPLGIALLYLLSCLTYLFALLSKEMAVTLPLIVICYEWRYGKEKAKLPSRLFNRYIIGYIAITIFYLYLRFNLFHNPEEQVEGWGLLERVLTIPWLIMSYMKLSFIPVHLSADYVIAPVGSPFSLNFIFSIIVIISIFTIIVIFGNRQRSILFGALFFLITLIPVYNLVPLSNPLAERYLYLPVAGFVISTGYITSLIAEKLKIGSAHRNRYVFVFFFVLIVLSLSIIKRNTIWRDDYSLWSDTVDKMPDSSKAHNNLGAVYLSQGHYDEAIYELKTVLRLNQRYADAHANLGVAYLSQGRIDEAIYELKTALRFKPGHTNTHTNLGNAYTRQGLLGQAIKEYLTAVGLKPDDAIAHYNLGVAYYAQRRFNEAINEFIIALKLKPDYKKAYYGLKEVQMEKRRVIKDAGTATNSQDKMWRP